MHRTTQGFRGALLIVMLLVTGWVGGVTTTNAQDQPVSIIFMHHSTGQGLIWQGGVREAFTELGYAFWDHGYNGEGLVDPSGTYRDMNWDVPGDNTDPDGWAVIFNQPVTDPPSNTLSHMLQHDVIIFKSCFPSSHIADEAMFERYQDYFLSIRAVMAQYPDKLFIPFTTPPLVPNETDAESAARARRWAEYVTSDAYLAGHSNIAAFDFFNALADADGYLRAEYRSDEWDSHPNEIANREVGPQFVAFVDQAIRDFVPGEAFVSVEIATEVESADPVDAAPGPDEDAYVPDVESDAGAFEGVLPAEIVVQEMWDYTSEPVTAFACLATDGGRLDDQAVALTFDIPAQGSAGCGVNFASASNVSTGQGIAFYVLADTPDLVLRVALGVRDPEHPEQSPGEAAPFDVELYLQNTIDWQQIIVMWDDLTKAEWFGDQGAQVFDPAAVAWLAFDVGFWEFGQTGTIMIDDVTLVSN